MDFMAGQALGALIFFAAFFLAVKFLESQKPKYKASQPSTEALPFVVKNDEIEQRIEAQMYESPLVGPVDVKDGPEGLGR